MAEVFKATITAYPDFLVAIKRILPQFSAHRELVNMLVTEASLTVGLSHPNVVPILDFGAVGDLYFLAMEYIHGKDLKSIMIRLKVRKGEFPIPLAVHIMAQVLRGLDYAHHKCDKYGRPLQLVHRDISPQNVMISFSGQVKILDFGIAKASARSPSTQAGVLKGKFSYMSPEQAKGEDVDPRTDIFSAGIVLWELLTLEPCFEGDTDIELLKNVRKGKVRHISDVNPKIPREFSEIVMKALQKKPRKRYATSGEFADALEKYQNERFGKLTEADTAAFLRNLYDVAPHEVETSAVTARTSDSTPAEQVTPLGIHRAPWLRRTPDWPWTASIHLAGFLAILVFFWVVPPMKIFLAFDRGVVRVAGKFHDWRQLPSRPQPASPSSAPAAATELFYSVQLAAAAQRALDDLPFENFERVRDFLTDLSSQPKPREARAIRERPGAWSGAIQGFRVVYQINDLPRTITVEQIEKAGK